MKYFAGHAWLEGAMAEDVTIEVIDGRFGVVEAGTRQGSSHRLDGVVLPGFANAHSHAFHRALRGRTHDRGGTFWTWRRRMYAVAAQLDPDNYLELARATYAEMALAGVTAVGEFHYLHHAPHGRRYDDPNQFAESLRQAAGDAGIRLTLLDTCYLAGGLTGGGHLPLDDVQQRFGDGTAEAWRDRVAQLRASPGVVIGAAVHSIRAVPRESLPIVAAALPLAPLHVHLSEQPTENDACADYYATTPTALLAANGVLGPRSTAVHATHLSLADIALLGESRTTACFCPTTERDLADGIGPARALRDAGSPLSLGSDQHAVIDLLEEARALELDERLASEQRGRFQPAELIEALTAQASIGWPDAGRIATGQRADLVAVSLTSPRTAGSAPAQVGMSATAADVRTVIADGRLIVDEGRHVLGDVGVLLSKAIDPIWRNV